MNLKAKKSQIEKMNLKIILIYATQLVTNDHKANEQSFESF